LLLHEHFTEGTLRELHEALLDETALIFDAADVARRGVSSACRLLRSRSADRAERGATIAELEARLRRFSPAT
jgi:hypothetical protein